MRTGQVFVSHTSDMAQFPGGRSFVQGALDAVGRTGDGTGRDANAIAVLGGSLPILLAGSFVLELANRLSQVSSTLLGAQGSAAAGPRARRRNHSTCSAIRPKGSRDHQH
jgi:hypothetical protein